MQQRDLASIRKVRLRSVQRVWDGTGLMSSTERDSGGIAIQLKDLLTENFHHRKKEKKLYTELKAK